ncbi:hypothetical protein PV04_08773 [Phialophora macrospora]|uniref:UBA domain-containing protein n=1 Tax=Phialophora macrospora TaxID=1851006 RepID=A0A0D2CF94_9EURO|nr:hypothetical protein PV04_08773 [Phialophora macrospora]
MVDTMDAMDSDITYCEGARLLQDARADIGSILIQRPNGGLICQHCYLVVADANDVKAIAPDQDWSLLVSCHVQACGSLHDRRAAYSCYACLERGMASVETSMAALKAHLQVCDLIREIKLSGQHGGQGDTRTASPMSRRSVQKPEINPRSNTTVLEPIRPRRPAGKMEQAQPTPNSARNPPLDPFGQAQDKPATPIQQMPLRVETPLEDTPPLPSRPKSYRPPTNTAETIYPPPTMRRAEQLVQPSPARPHESDMYNIPGGFPGSKAAAVPDSRVSSMHDYSPTVPLRRKEVRTEAPGPSQASASDAKSFPTAPSRAPPAPPVLSPPAPPPYHQGKDAHGSLAPQQSSAQAGSAQTPSTNMYTGPDPVKVQQLVSFGIPRMDAEYLLNRTGGDVNAAAELQLSEMGSLSGHARETSPQALQSTAFPAPLGSNPPLDRRNNRRSK